MDKILKNLIKFLSLATFIFPVLLQAYCWDATLRVADFHPLSKRVQKIYSNDIPFYQLEVGYRFQENWSAWGDVGFLTEKGKSIGCNDGTRMSLLPLGLGINYHSCIPLNWGCCQHYLDGYLGAGVTYSFVRFHDDSDFVKEHVKKQNWGGVVKSGIRYCLSPCAYLEFFVDYFFTRFNFDGDHDDEHSCVEHRCVERNDVNMNGIIFGGGLGFKF